MVEATTTINAVSLRKAMSGLAPDDLVTWVLNALSFLTSAPKKKAVLEAILGQSLTESADPPIEQQSVVDILTQIPKPPDPADLAEAKRLYDILVRGGFDLAAESFQKGDFSTLMNMTEATASRVRQSTTILNAVDRISKLNEEFKDLGTFKGPESFVKGE